MTLGSDTLYKIFALLWTTLFTALLANIAETAESAVMVQHNYRPRAWNNPPNFITDCSFSCTSKQYLKTYLYSVYHLEHITTHIL